LVVRKNEFILLYHKSGAVAKIFKQGAQLDTKLV